MFVGTTPPEVKILLQDILTGRKGEDIFVGCSGNFSSDKILASMGFNVHSNDVSLYSKLIADIVLGTDTKVDVLNEDLATVFAQWEESKYRKLVQVMFAIKLSDFAQKKNLYQIEFYENYLANADKYYESTIQKIEKNQQFDFKINDFFYGDFIEHLKNKPKNSIGVSYPPTYKGGYEKMFRFIEESFGYERAPYNLFDPKEGATVFGDLLDNGENIIYSDQEHELLKKYEVAKVGLGAGKKPIYVYSSVLTDKIYYIERQKKQNKSKYAVIPYEYEFTAETKIEVQVCKVEDVNYFKAFYMANKVNYTEGGDFALVFLADGKVFGFASFSKMLSDFHFLFMQSDFVVNSSAGKLSKLLIMLMKSREVRKLSIRFFKHFYKGVKTTVYTDKPVSMKYRGVFELDRRDKGKLIYSAGFTEDTTSKIYEIWLKKHQK